MKTKSITIRINEDLYGSLEKEAESKCLTLSDYVRQKLSSVLHVGSNNPPAAQSQNSGTKIQWANPTQQVQSIEHIPTDIVQFMRRWRPAKFGEREFSVIDGNTGESIKHFYLFGNGDSEKIVLKPQDRFYALEISDYEVFESSLGKITPNI